MDVLGYRVAKLDPHKIAARAATTAAGSGSGGGGGGAQVPRPGQPHGDDAAVVKAVLAQAFPDRGNELFQWVGPDCVPGYAVFITQTAADGTTVVSIFRSTAEAPRMFAYTRCSPPSASSPASTGSAGAAASSSTTGCASSEADAARSDSGGDDGGPDATPVRPFLERVLSITPHPTLGGRYSLPAWQLFQPDGVTPVQTMAELAGRAPSSRTGTSSGAAAAAGEAGAAAAARGGGGGATRSGMFLFFRGGRFIWPAVRLGFRRRLQFRGRALELVTLSTRPVLLAVKEFLTPEECAHIQEVATPHLKQSAVSKMDADVGKPTEEWRTSSTHFLDKCCTPGVTEVEARVAFVTRHPPPFAEGIQVLRYERGGRYAHHLDWFDPKAYGSNASLMRTIRYGAKNRLATLFWYMSEVESGGGTNFPKANASAAEALRPMYEEMGAVVEPGGAITVLPAVGKAILFYNLMPDGAGDLWSLHAGSQVNEGVKWAANKWIWNQPDS